MKKLFVLVALLVLVGVIASRRLRET